MLASEKIRTMKIVLSALIAIIMITAIGLTMETAPAANAAKEEKHRSEAALVAALEVAPEVVTEAEIITKGEIAPIKPEVARPEPVDKKTVRRTHQHLLMEDRNHRHEEPEPEVKLLAVSYEEDDFFIPVEVDKEEASIEVEETLPPVVAEILPVVEDTTAETVAETTETTDEKSGWTYVGTKFITGYDTCVDCCGKSDGITASGAYASPWWTCAMGYSFPFGTVIYIDGLGTFCCQDRGAFGDEKVDILVNNHPEAYEITGYYDVYVVSWG